MMKKLLFSFMLLLVLPGLCAAQDGFRVFGKLGGTQGGKLFLMVHNPEGLARLDEAEMVEGNFEFSGHVDGPVVAYITTDKQQLVSTIMLENTNYTLTAGATGIDVAGGGESQKIWNQFDAINKKIAREKMMAEQEVRAAYMQKNQAAVAQVNGRIEKILQKAREEERELLTAHGDSYVAAFAIVSRLEQIPAGLLPDLFGLLSESIQTSFFGNTIRMMMERYKQTDVGAIAPNFKAPLVEGGYLILHETKAKVKLIDFWASWCAPCRQENKNLPKLYKKYKEKGLEIISISVDKQEYAWLKAIEEDKMTWKNAFDVNAVISGVYNVKGIPHTILLDEENRIVAKNLRGAALQKKIAEMLGEK